MANQITHIVLAEKVSDQIFKRFDPKAFFTGTVFPDIRYLKVIERDKTHHNGLSFQDILDEQNPFIAGLKYHSLVDEVREKYIVGKGIYTLTPSSKFLTQALKSYEDEILYNYVSDWNQIIKYLDDVLPEEIKLVEQTDKIRMWHSLMQAYFKELPTDISRKNFICRLGFSEEVAIEMNTIIDQLRQVPKIKEIILGFYQEWNLLIRKSS